MKLALGRSVVFSVAMLLIGGAYFAWRTHSVVEYSSSMSLRRDIATSRPLLRQIAFAPLPPAPRRGGGHSDPRFCSTLDGRATDFVHWKKWSTVTGHSHPSAEGLAMVDALGVLSPMSPRDRGPPEPEHSRFGTIAARAGCAHYPYSTGVALEHILPAAVKSRWGKNDVGCVAMTFQQFVGRRMLGDETIDGFMRNAWPVVLAKNISLAILTEWGDDSAPWELLTCELRMTPKQVAAFVRTPNLLHWYTQNWDLAPSPHKRIHYRTAGTDVPTHDACVDNIARKSWPLHDVPFCAPRDVDVLRKVSPLPIGMDFMRTPYPRSPNASMLDARNTCPLRTMLEEMTSVKAAALPFAEKKAKLLVAFGGARNTRLGDYRALASLSSAVVTDLPKMGGRVAVETMWKIASEHMFVASPASHGQDCFRQWEAMALGSVPVRRYLVCASITLGGASIFLSRLMTSPPLSLSLSLALSLFLFAPRSPPLTAPCIR